MSRHLRMSRSMQEGSVGGKNGSGLGSGRCGIGGSSVGVLYFKS